MYMWCYNTMYIDTCMHPYVYIIIISASVTKAECLLFRQHYSMQKIQDIQELFLMGKHKYMYVVYLNLSSQPSNFATVVLVYM